MREIGIALVLVALILIFVSRAMARRRDAVLSDISGDVEPPLLERDPVGARPVVVDFHVSGSEARVTFDVPLPERDDDILANLLADEAIEVVREKRHSLPIVNVTEVVALAGREAVREVSRAKLSAPGELPPPVRGEVLNLAHIAKDPFAHQFETDHTVLFDTKAVARSDELGPIGDSIQIPRALETGLRARGINPETMTATELVTGLLHLFGYTVAPGPEQGTFIADHAGTRTYIHSDPYTEGGHPEANEDEIRRFIVGLEVSRAQRGLFVSDKYAPFSIYEREGRDTRVRFVTRERLQKFVDSLALG